jgi:hypothetical protein
MFTHPRFHIYRVNVHTLHMQTTSAVVRLLDAALRPSEPTASAKEISRLMEALTPDALGLKVPHRGARAAAGSSASTPSEVLTHTIHEGRELELVIFFFPPGASLPLHDHPGMTVYSKVLYGSLALLAYDWEEPVTRQELEGASEK